MKKVFASILLLTVLASGNGVQAQTESNKTIGFSFISNDFITAQRIRQGTLSQVLRDKQVSNLSETGLGFAVTYSKAVLSGIDLATTLGGSFARFSLPGKRISDNKFLLEIDASANFKMLRDSATLNPYLIAGIGASKYSNVYGAFIPVGGGFKLNLFGEASLFTQLQYRIPVTPDANAHHFQVSFGISGRL